MAGVRARGRGAAVTSAARSERYIFVFLLRPGVTVEHEHAISEGIRGHLTFTFKYIQLGAQHAV